MNFCTRILACSLLGLLSACSTLSESECRTVDWYLLGQKDGAAGYDRNERLGQHHEACAKLGIYPAQADYTAGWQRGIRQYCSPENAYQAGRRGQSYTGTCPPDQDRLFRLNRDLGYRIYDLEQQIGRNEREIRELEQKLSRKDLKDSDRPALRNRIRHLDYDQSLLRESKRHAEMIPPYR